MSTIRVKYLNFEFIVAADHMVHAEGSPEGSLARAVTTWGLASIMACVRTGPDVFWTHLMCDDGAANTPCGTILIHVVSAGFASSS